MDNSAEAEDSACSMDQSHDDSGGVLLREKGCSANAAAAEAGEQLGPFVGENTHGTGD